MKKKISTPSNGELNKALPLIYFDSSVVIDYYRANILEQPATNRSGAGWGNTLSEERKLVRGIMRADSRINKMHQIRTKLISGQARVAAATSPLCILELVKWHAEVRFRQMAAESAQMHLVQRKSEKEIGEYLKNLALRLRDKSGEFQGRGGKETVDHGAELKSLMSVISKTALDASFQKCHELYGLREYDIVSFNLPIDWEKRFLSLYAYFQVGAADIIHILFAEHLGCSYFASWDEDFKRVQDIMEGHGIKLLGSPDDILRIL